MSGPGAQDPGIQDPWQAMSTLVAGPVAWGAIGFGVDAVTGSGAFVPIGLVVGFVASLWFVWHQHTHAPTARPTARPTTTTSDEQGDLP